MQITFGTLDLTPTIAEQAPGFAQESQREIQVSLPIRATAAVQYDRGNRLFTVRLTGPITREFATYALAHAFACEHPTDVFDEGKASVIFIKGGASATLSNALGKATIVRTYGVAVEVMYEFTGGPWL